MRIIRAAAVFLLLPAAMAATVAATQSGGPSTEQAEPPEPPPVTWQEWSDEVFQRAREEQKGVLLTIVYPGCRPCEVADREVYADPVVRRLIDRLWIPVRVDAFDRPDIDDRYRLALSVLTRGGSGGYPVTGFLFSTGEAMWVDDFIPARDREARPGMRALLVSMDRLWKTRFDEARGNALAVQAALDGEDRARRGGALTATVVNAITDHVVDMNDREHGGFGPPPRRQNSFAARLVLLASLRRGDRGLRGQALEALRGPVRGALHDQLDGGFHMATRSPDWSVPWFGKDLAVNASYLQALADAVAATGDEELAAAASETVDFILGTLGSTEGGFRAGQLGSLPGSESAAYFAWETERLGEALDETELAWAEALFGYRPGGEPLLGLPARFTLKERPGALERAAELGLDPSEAERRRAEILGALRGIREAKPAPEVLPARYAGSSAMACSALLAAGRALDRADAVQAALKALEAMASGRKLSDGVPHSLHDPEGSPVLMADQAHLGNAFLDAHEQTGDPGYLKAAGEVVKGLLDRFDAPDGAFYDVVEQGKAAGYVRIRRKEANDTSRPSPQVVAARLLFRYGSLTGETALVDRAEKAVSWGLSRLPDLDLSGATLALALDSMLNGPVIVRLGSGDDGELRRAALDLYEPARVVVTSGKAMEGAEICVGDRCRKEIGSPEDMARALRELRAGGGVSEAAGAR